MPTDQKQLPSDDASNDDQPSNPSSNSDSNDARSKDASTAATAITSTSRSPHKTRTETNSNSSDTGYATGKSGNGSTVASRSDTPASSDRNGPAQRQHPLRQTFTQMHPPTAKSSRAVPFGHKHAHSAAHSADNMSTDEGVGSSTDSARNISSLVKLIRLDSNSQISKPPVITAQPANLDQPHEHALPSHLVKIDSDATAHSITSPIIAPTNGVSDAQERHEPAPQIRSSGIPVAESAQLPPLAPARHHVRSQRTAPHHPSARKSARIGASKGAVAHRHASEMHLRYRPDAYALTQDQLVHMPSPMPVTTPMLIAAQSSISQQRTQSISSQTHESISAAQPQSDPSQQQSVAWQAYPPQIQTTNPPSATPSQPMMVVMMPQQQQPQQIPQPPYPIAYPYAYMPPYASVPYPAMPIIPQYTPPHPAYFYAPPYYTANAGVPVPMAQIPVAVSAQSYPSMIPVAPAISNNASFHDTATDQTPASPPTQQPGLNPPAKIEPAMADVIMHSNELQNQQKMNGHPINHAQSEQNQHQPPNQQQASNPNAQLLNSESADIITRFFESTDQARREEAGIKYKLTVVQQPKRARMIGFGEKDRRPIDPPPVVHLATTDIHGEEFVAYSDAPFLVMHASLWSEDMATECSIVVNPFYEERSGPRYMHAIVGLLTSQCYILCNSAGERGMYFIFPEISIRVSGRFRLKFMLFSVKDIFEWSEGAAKAILFSDVFTVFTPKDFPGVAMSTELSKAFSRQGVRIYIRPEGPIGRARVNAVRQMTAAALAAAAAATAASSAPESAISDPLSSTLRDASDTSHAHEPTDLHKKPTDQHSTAATVG